MFYRNSLLYEPTGSNQLQQLREEKKMFEMTEEEFLECEQAERQKHDEKVRELENMEVDMEVDK